MTKGGVNAAKQYRDKCWTEFKSACQDLQEEVEPADGIDFNQRRLKVKRDLVIETHDRCLTASAQVWNLEKTSPTDEVNWNWVNTNLRRPKNDILRRVETKLSELDSSENPEELEKALADEKLRKLKIELASFEGEVKAEIEGLEHAVEETTIWVSSNHTPLMDCVNGIQAKVSKEHLELCNKLVLLLESNRVQEESDKHEAFRAELRPKVAVLKAKLLSKTPVGSVQTGEASTVSSVIRPAVQSSQGMTQPLTQTPAKSKFKMAPIPIPKFSGRVVDYPEWKKLFRECIEGQYQDSAAIMVLRTQALPDSIANMIPRCTSLVEIWEKLDKKFLDSARVWKGVKADLKALDRRKLGNNQYMTALVSKILDAENLLDTVGMVHWLRQEDKIPEYEDLLTDSEKLEWVKMKPTLNGTPWENFKSFLIKMRDWYEEIAKVGTTDQEALGGRKSKCDFCKRRGHDESQCFKKQNESGGSKKGCYKCGSDDHFARSCPESVDGTSNKIKQKSKKQDALKQDSHSNYLRTKDCRWCGRTYNTEFSCSGCGKKWPAKSKAEHCLAHCVEYTAASAKEKGDMVIKGSNCIICLHHEHSTDSCFGKDQQRSICGLGGCKKKHHPSLHSAPQVSIQAVQAIGNLSVCGDVDPGVQISEDLVEVGVNVVKQKHNPQGAFLKRLEHKKTLHNKINWNDKCWTETTKQLVERNRAQELDELESLLKLPAIEGNQVLLVMQNVTVKYGKSGGLSEISVFWDNGSTCSLVLTETAEALGCPGEEVVVSIETVNGEITRRTKIYCIELMSNSGERFIIKAFGVENISEVQSLLVLSEVKEKFTHEVQTQWGKISKRPFGKINLLVGQEYAGLHPVHYEARDNLVVCRSMFGNGWLITGHDEDLQPEKCTWGEEVAAMRLARITVLDHANNRITVSNVKLTYTQERDYFTLDELGIEPARRCPRCKGCRDCSWRGQQLSQKEASELEYMEKCVEFENNRFKVRFPFLVDPSELADNYGQVVRIAEAEERKLEREGRMQEFNELFQKLVELGAIEEISKKELKEWSGPVHYVSLQHVINEDSATTGLRIVTNSSLKTPGNPHTLNSIMAVGPNLMTDPYKILLRFRSYIKGLNSDVTKAYYQMFTGLIEKHVRRIVWRYGNKQSEWIIFGYLVVSFGDACAAGLLEICFKLIIAMFGVIDLIAARRLKDDRFVDDITTGGNNKEVQRFKGVENKNTLECDGTMQQILSGANWKLKAVAISGEPDGAALER